MIKPPRFLAIALAALAAIAVFSNAYSQTKPEIIQTIPGFRQPISCVFSPDNGYLFVVNHAVDSNGTLRDQSFVSRLRLAPDGTAEVEKMRFVDQLTAPVDLDFSPVRFGSIPQGAIFLVAGTPLVQDEAGRGLKDLSRIMIGIIVIDPRTGKIIKTLDLSPNSRVELEKDHSLLAPSSIAFDKQGNMYIGEAGFGGHLFAKRESGRPGLWRFTTQDVIDLLEDRQPKKVEFVRTTSMPSDITYRKENDQIFFATNHNQGRPTGSVFVFTSSTYSGLSSMQTIVRGLDALSGLRTTPTGRVIMASSGGELLFPKGKKDARPVRFRPQNNFSSPGKVALATLKDGTILIAVPEQSSDAGIGKGQRVSMVTLPSNY